ncbi:MAG: ribonuclease D [Alphaproteobacteria bacterium]|nr:ribonuclease D [Rickettsiales bacterium]
MTQVQKQKSIFLDSSNIDEFIDQAIINGVVGIDTEFERIHSYFPKLSLIQFCFGDKTTYIYDFLERKVDANKIIEILTNPSIIKVAHAIRQDVEAIHYAIGAVTKPLVDTQIIAKELGLGRQLSYAYLVKKFFGILVDKDCTRSNWMQRPLDDEKILYAAIDVYYLVDLYSQMKTIITQESFHKAVESGNKMAIKSITYKTSQEAWNSFKKSIISKGCNIDNIQNVTKALFLFRKNIARKRNILPNLIIKDKAMLEMAKMPDITPELINKITKLPPYINPDGVASLIKKTREDTIKGKQDEKDRI